MQTDRLFFKCSLILFFFCLATGPSWAAEAGTWNFFKEHFVTPDGRIIDRGRQDMSHSEGQGYGLLLAQASNDRQAFERIWLWTRNNLQVREEDKLFAWSWGKRESGEWSFLDRNNATDGDICIAYSLLLAARKWQISSYKAEALAIINSMKEELLVEKYGYAFLLPGDDGFVTDKGFILNPAYMICSAFRLFAEVTGDPIWSKVYGDALKIIGASLYSSLILPPDWLLLTDSGTHISTEKSSGFGYEAIRVFLYLAWDHSLATVPGVEKLFHYYEGTGRLPVFVDLVANSLSLDEAPAGFYAILARSAEAANKGKLASRLWQRAKMKICAEKENYYSQILFLLAKINRP